ncbi:hypothetical protein COB55_00030 [Candidatus Wolfebacteria bacterium]|nr:MAG: hypothetical protein COB55_00030 [Candidatus Wolfebacteria bacterium]
MTILLTLFILSLVCIISVLSLKYWEDKKHVVLFARARTNADMRTRRFFDRIASDTKERVHSGFHFSLHAIMHGLHTSVTYIKQSTERRLVRVLNFIRGRGSHKQTGSASFFLRRIAHHKEQMQNGPIDN